MCIGLSNKFETAMAQDVLHGRILRGRFGDDFLDAVAEKCLQIIGPPTDDHWNEYFDFDRSTTLRISPDVLVWSTGYRSHLTNLSGGVICLKDFYRACVHTDGQNLFLIGFARPIIGNIPSISEIQAKYTVGILSGKFKLPPQLKEKQEAAWKLLCKEYGTINTENVHPVEQFPYSDELARDMGIMPTLARVKSLKTWLKIMLTPASTIHYVDQYFDGQLIDQQKVFTPPILVALLTFMRLFDYPLRMVNRIRQITAT